MGTYSDLVQTSPSPTQKEEKKNKSEKRTSERSLEPTNHGTNQRTKEPTKQPTNVPTSEGTNQRTLIRHSFDIYEDQLKTLRQHKLEGVLMGNKEAKIGNMIREAIDEYFAKKGNRTNEGTYVGTNEGSNEPTNGIPNEKRPT